MEKYTEYINQLSWIMPKTEQDKAVSFLSTVNDWDYKDCIICSQKDVWENLVKVISKRKKEEVKSLLPDLLYMLKDLNWPGALNAMNIIKTFSQEEILPDIEQSLKTADSENDGIWIANLKNLVDYFVLTPDLFSSIDLKQVLLKSEW